LSDNMHTIKLLAGLTGGIGCGKTSVARMLAKYGAPIVDVDIAGRWVLEHDERAKNLIRETFGHGVFTNDGEIDRRKLGEIVFASEENLKKLNRIVHPPMLEKVRKEIKTLIENDVDHPYIVVDAALIYELGLHEMLDVVIAVSAPPEVSLQRTHLRDSLSAEQIKQRIKAQLPLETKVQRADYVIDNSGTFKDLQHQVEKLHHWLLEKAKEKSLHEKFKKQTRT